MSAPSPQDRFYSSILTLTPRGLGRELAAAYIGVSPTKFDDLVKDGRMPRPKKMDGRRIWDRVALDSAFSAFPDPDSPKPGGWQELLNKGRTGTNAQIHQS